MRCYILILFIYKLFIRKLSREYLMIVLLSTQLQLCSQIFLVKANVCVCVYGEREKKKASNEC